MKKLTATILLTMLFSAVVYSQTLQKGSLVGLHYGTVNLNPDVTMNQFKAFFTGTYIPEVEKTMTGMKVLLGKGVRGENENAVCVIYLFDSEASRNKYFNADGSPSEAGKTAFDKLQGLSDKLAKMGTMSTKYTDWLIQ